MKTAQATSKSPSRGHVPSVPRPPRVELACRAGQAWIDQARLLRVAAFALRAEGFRRGALSLAVVGAQRMSALHWAFHRVRGPTDVITFDLGGAPRAGLIEGEIVMCANVARRMARRRAAQPIAPPRAVRHGAGRSRRPGPSLENEWNRELCLYLVHGILHLSGYDDHTPADFAALHRREDELLEQAGVGRVFAS